MLSVGCLGLLLLGVLIGYGYLNSNRTSQLVVDVSQRFGWNTKVRYVQGPVRGALGLLSLLCSIGAGVILLLWGI